MSATTTQPKSVAPAKFEQELVQMDQGVQQSLPAGTVLTIDGTAMKQPAIDTKLAGYITTFKAVDAAKAAYQEAVAARLAITVEARTFYKQLKAVLKTYFASQPSVLATFGLSPDKAIASSAKTKLLAVGKRSQTRKVRGTKSKKQAKAITVVGEPPLTMASDGTLQIGAPTVNVPASTSSSTTPASSAVSTPSSSPATPAGNTTPSGSTPAAGQ
jgi:hypothetical protein